MQPLDHGGPAGQGPELERPVGAGVDGNQRSHPGGRLLGRPGALLGGQRKAQRRLPGGPVDEQSGRRLGRRADHGIGQGQVLLHLMPPG